MDLTREDWGEQGAPSWDRPGGSGRGRDVFFWLAAGGALALYLGFILALGLGMVSNIKCCTLIRILCCPEIHFAIKLSLYTATVSTLIAMLLAVPAAYTLSQYRGPGKSLFDTLLDLPLVLPPIGVGFLLLVFFRTALGQALETHVMRFVFEVPGIILAQFAVASGFAMRVLKSTFDGLNPRYEEVARTLGLSKWQAFSHIVLPLSRNGVLASTVLTWARSIGEFGATMIVAGTFAGKTEVLTIALMMKWQMAEIEQGLTVTLLLIVISLTALLLFRKIGERHYA